MMEESIYKEDMKILKVSASDWRISEFMKHKHSKNQLDKSTIILGEFNTYLKLMEQTRKLKVNKPKYPFSILGLIGIY